MAVALQRCLVLSARRRRLERYRIAYLTAVLQVRAIVMEAMRKKHENLPRLFYQRINRIICVFLCMCAMCVSLCFVSAALNNSSIKQNRFLRRLVSRSGLLQKQTLNLSGWAPIETGNAKKNCPLFATPPLSMDGEISLTYQ